MTPEACAPLIATLPLEGADINIRVVRDGRGPDCNIWSNFEQDLEITDYFCPDCKSKHKRVSTVEQMNTSKSSECASTSKEKLPEMVPVCCFGMEALYLPEKHMILCQCKSCKERIMSLSEWERHTGSRKKNWKMSVKLKSTGEPLITLDSAAVTGLAIAAASLVVVQMTGNAMYDPIGSIIVGNLLGMVAIFLIQRNRHALIGRAIDDHDMQRVLEFLKSDPVVKLW